MTAAPVMRVRRAPGVLDDEIEGRAVLVGPAGTELVHLNAAGSATWAAIDGHLDAAGLAAAVWARLAAADRPPTPAVLERDVVTFLEHLARLGLVIPDGPG